MVEINGTSTNVLIDTGASVNVINLALLQKMTSHPEIKPTRARIYPNGTATPLPLRGVIEITVTTKTRKTREKFYIAHGKVGTLLGYLNSKVLRLVGFARRYMR